MNEQNENNHLQNAQPRGSALNELLSYGHGGLPDKTIILIDDLALSSGKTREEIFIALRDVSQVVVVAFSDFAKAAHKAVEAFSRTDSFEKLKTSMDELNNRLDDQQETHRSHERFLPKPIGQQRRR